MLATATTAWQIQHILPIAEEEVSSSLAAAAIMLSTTLEVAPLVGPYVVGPNVISSSNKRVSIDSAGLSATIFDEE